MFWLQLMICDEVVDAVSDAIHPHLMSPYTVGCTPFDQGRGLGQILGLLAMRAWREQWTA